MRLWTSILLASSVLAGCASMEEWFVEKPQPPRADGTPRPPTREVHRRIEVPETVGWWKPSAGETLAQAEPLKVPAEGGVEFGGMKEFDLRRVGPTILIWAGIGVAAIGVALAIWFSVKTGLLTAAGGGVLIVAGIAFEAYPWLALVLVCAAILGALVWFVWGTAAGARLRKNFSAVVQGVENAGDKAKPVKDEIKKAAKTAGTKASLDKAVAKAVP